MNKISFEIVSMAWCRLLVISHLVLTPIDYLKVLLTPTTQVNDFEPHVDNLLSSPPSTKPPLEALNLAYRRVQLRRQASTTPTCKGNTRPNPYEITMSLTHHSKD